MGEAALADIFASGVTDIGRAAALATDAGVNHRFVGQRCDRQHLAKFQTRCTKIAQ